MTDDRQNSVPDPSENVEVDAPGSGHAGRPGALSAFKSGIEFVGRHPFATGLLAILSVVGLVLSVYGFALDRRDAGNTTDQVASIETSLQAVRSELDGLDESLGDASIEQPVKIEFGRWGAGIDAVLFDSTATDVPLMFDSSQQKTKWLNDIYTDQAGYSSTPFFNFSVSSEANRNFVQIAPYLLIHVMHVEPVPQNVAGMYLGERGGAAILREFRTCLLPEPGVQIASLDQRNYPSRIDFITLEPGEVEEFHFTVTTLSDYVYHFRIGLQVKFKGESFAVWHPTVYRRAKTSRTIPLVTWRNDSFLPEPYPDGSTLVDHEERHYQCYADEVTEYERSRVFNTRQIEQEIVTADR